MVVDASLISSSCGITCNPLSIPKHNSLQRDEPRQFSTILLHQAARSTMPDGTLYGDKACTQAPRPQGPTPSAAGYAQAATRTPLVGFSVLLYLPNSSSPIASSPHVFSQEA
ncbi:hypothetical protein Adt_31746 [Abeliophyllum distichum]|uniref:Uncharacterized protein n=1 Tax=Abeliophyllum distichum TaxID=126358 RepID=A0ABD1REZ8_9LAMI